jgi:3-isopropylmalate/(R)-2-methylmalate dehydratase small subunit
MRQPSSSETYPIVTGKAWAFGIDVPADQILPPGEEAARDPARYVMTPIDPDFPARLAPGDIVVGGTFAAGTRDDLPVRALRAAGVAAVVASRLDPTFARLAVHAGLPAVEIHEALAIHSGAVLRVDLEGTRVVNLSSGDRYPIRNLDDATLARYRQSR